MDFDVVALAGWIGAVAFAISGFLIAARKGLDLIGIFIVMMLTMNGGGALRDILINRIPLVLQDTTPFLLGGSVLIICWLLGFHRNPRFENNRFFVLCDAVGLATFAITGTMAGLEAGLPLFGVMALAFLTAAGGGIIRDMLVGEVPLILSRDFYGTVALIVALVLFLLNHFGWLNDYTVALTLLGGLALRLLAFHYRWQLPRPIAKTTSEPPK